MPKIHGYNGGIKIISLLLYLSLFISCNEAKNIEFEFRFRAPERVIHEHYTLKIRDTKDSCVYVYESRDQERLSFNIYKQSGMLHFYFDDNPKFIQAKHTGHKDVECNGKMQIINCYWISGPELGDLLCLFFTQEYGLLLMKYDLQERVLVKFSGQTDEIQGVISAIKEDSEFYTWGGREHFAPPVD